MSGSSSLSAAKRRRNNVPVNPSSKIVQEVPKKIPHPLDILKYHELRIRSLEGQLKASMEKQAGMESLMSMYKNELSSLSSKVNKVSVDKPTISTFSNLQINDDPIIEENVDSGSDGSD